MNDDFEQRLREQKLRRIPPEWRQEILQAAHASARTRPSTLDSRLSWLSILNHQLSALLWPHPRAWAGLAAVWLVAFTLNLATRDEPQVSATRADPPSAELRVALKQQEQLRAELLDLSEARDARPKDADTAPRSERRAVILST